MLEIPKIFYIFDLDFFMILSQLEGQYAIAIEKFRKRILLSCSKVYVLTIKTTKSAGCVFYKISIVKNEFDEF